MERLKVLDVPGEISLLEVLWVLHKQVVDVFDLVAQSSQRILAQLLILHKLIRGTLRTGSKVTSRLPSGLVESLLFLHVFFFEVFVIDLRLHERNGVERRILYRLGHWLPAKTTTKCPLLTIVPGKLSGMP